MKEVSIIGVDLAKQVFGRGGKDALVGSAGDDYLFGGKGHDGLYGRAGG